MPLAWWPSTLLDSAGRHQGTSDREESDVALGLLEWSFIALVGGLTVLAGLFALYVVLQVFRNPSRRSP